MTYSVNHNHHVTVLTDWVNSPGWISEPYLNSNRLDGAWISSNLTCIGASNLTQPGQPNPCGQPRPTSRYHSCHFWRAPVACQDIILPNLQRLTVATAFQVLLGRPKSFGCWAPGTPRCAGRYPARSSTVHPLLRITPCGS